MAREYIERRAPDSRKRLRRAIRLLESEKGDIKALKGDLCGSDRVKGTSRTTGKIESPPMRPHGQRDHHCQETASVGIWSESAAHAHRPFR